MSDYELYDLMGTWEIKLVVWVIFLAVILAAYLLVAYRAGRNLSRLHAFIITSLMLWFSFIITSNIHSSLQTLIELRELAFFGYTFLRNAAAFMWLATLGCGLAPVVCVLFLYKVRHPPGQKDRRRKQE